MDILSFVLGISFVVVICLTIVAVIGFVKGNKNERALKEINEDVYRELGRLHDELHREIEELHKIVCDEDDRGKREIMSIIDSRIDKLGTKVHKD